MVQQECETCHKFTAFFYPYNLGLGPKAELMLLLYGDITLGELFATSYKKILSDHKRKIGLLSRELPEILNLLQKKEYISWEDRVERNRANEFESTPMQKAIDELLATTFPGDGSLQNIMITKQTDWNKDFKDKSQDLWDSGYPLIYWSIPNEKKEEVNKLFDKSDGNFLNVLGEERMFKNGFFNQKIGSKNKELIEKALCLGILMNYPHGSDADFGNGYCCRTLEEESCYCDKTPITYLSCYPVQNGGIGGCAEHSNPCASQSE